MDEALDLDFSLVWFQSPPGIDGSDGREVVEKGFRQFAVASIDDRRESGEVFTNYAGT